MFTEDGRAAVVVFHQRTDAYLCARALEESYIERDELVPILDMQAERDALDNALLLPNVLKRKLHTLSLMTHESLDLVRQRFSDYDLDVLLVNKIIKRGDVYRLNFQGVHYPASPDPVLTRMNLETLYYIN